MVTQIIKPLRFIAKHRPSFRVNGSENPVEQWEYTQARRAAARGDGQTVQSIAQRIHAQLQGI